jgi:glycosyltransferase involved in cell wall biosynthesis
MEAMACETPQILAKSVSVNDSSNWFHGLTYEPLNPKDLAKKIVYLLKNEELRGEIGKKSRETALGIGDWKKNLKIQENLYEKLTEGGY